MNDLTSFFIMHSMVYPWMMSGCGFEDEVFSARSKSISKEKDGSLELFYYQIGAHHFVVFVV
jgi:hypothetical protein